MSNDMKCPVCNKPMKQATYDYDKKDNDDTLYMSIMPCDCVCSYGASKAVWQELTRTRKALDVAVDALEEAREEIGKIKNNDCPCGKPHIWFTIDNALEQIKDNDKDVK